MRRRTGHVELNVSDLEVSVLLQDPRMQLEIWHQKRIQENLVVDLFSLNIFEVIHDSFLNHKKLHTLQLIDTIFK